MDGGTIKGLFGVAVLLPFAVNTGAQARVEFEGSSFEVVVEVAADGESSRLRLEGRNDGGEALTRALPGSLQYVDDVRPTHGKLLVMGRTSQRNDLLTVYDAGSLDLLEVILCRDLTLSPSGRFAVFERFFPRMAPRQYAYHVTLLYDFAATPASNRLAGVPVPDPETRRSIDAGRPLYPDSIVEFERYVPNEEATHGHESKDRNSAPPYAWSPDERFVAFVVHRSRGESRTSSLVVIEIDDDGRPLRHELVELEHDFHPVMKIGFVNGSVRLERRVGERGKEIRVFDFVF